MAKNDPKEEEAWKKEFEHELTHEDFKDVEDEFYEDTKADHPDTRDSSEFEEEPVSLHSPWLDDMDKTMQGEEFEGERPVVVVPREDWSERPPPRPMAPLKLPVDKIHIKFNSGTKECYSKEQCIDRIRQIEQRDIRMFGYDDISFNWLIGGDGNVYEGRGWHAKPALCLENPEMNHEKMIDVTYIGEFETKYHSFDMYTTYVNWLRESINNHYIIEDYDYLL